MAVRDAGAWEGWLKFFLRGVCEVAQGATETGRKILALREAHRHMVGARINGAVNGLRLLELLFQTPIVNVGLVRDTLSVSQPTANSLVNRFTEIGLLREMTGRPRNRLFSYDPYLALFESPLTADGVATTPADSTASATS